MENFGFDFMLASDASERAEEILSGEEYRNWVMEPKLDGIRAMVHVDNGEVRVFLRGRGGFRHARVIKISEGEDLEVLR